MNELELKNIELWKNTNIDHKLKKELESLSGEALHDAFYTDLAFGTGGMRGVIGVGTNRMNVYVIRKASKGFCDFLKEKYPNDYSRGIVIAYDCRNQSWQFAKATAQTFASAGVPVYLFSGLRPTPELSFAVRHLKCIGGVMVTASHNPPEYNGYKIYDEDGCQLVPEMADQVIEKIQQITDIFSVKVDQFDQLRNKGLIKLIDKEVDAPYIEKVKSVSVKKVQSDKIEIVFTPLHGTASVHLAQLLKDAGYIVYPVEAQMVADPNFTSVKSPNPEDKNAFKLAEELGKEVQADILLATDPDADRMGVAVRLANGEYEYLNGNQTGAIMLEYLAKYRPHKAKANVYNTIVSSNIAMAICAKYNLNLIQTLTGFKFIGEQAKKIENTDEEFFFGYEESYGYVVKDFVRDKDSLQASLLLAEIAAHFKQEKKTLVDALNDIYNQYGFYLDGVENIYLKGATGLQRIERIMRYFQNLKLEEIAGKKVVSIEDYDTLEKTTKSGRERLHLPRSFVLKYIFEDGGWFVLRPSGTEPKLKVYISIVGKTKQEAETFIKRLSSIILTIIAEVE